jgi:hypothetical protein
MIDWNAESWGGRVHLAANGSWVPDRHDTTEPEQD